MLQPTGVAWEEIDTVLWSLRYVECNSISYQDHGLVTVQLLGEKKNISWDILKTCAFISIQNEQKHDKKTMSLKPQGLYLFREMALQTLKIK